MFTFFDFVCADHDIREKVDAFSTKDHFSQERNPPIVIKSAAKTTIAKVWLVQRFFILSTLFWDYIFPLLFVVSCNPAHKENNSPQTKYFFDNVTLLWPNPLTMVKKLVRSWHRMKWMMATGRWRRWEGWIWCDITFTNQQGGWQLCFSRR